MGVEMSSIEELSFEEAFAALEEIVADLEGGGLTLEESLSLFERGQILAEHCDKRLEEAELKIKQLTPEGEVIFDPEA
jgi:exodeoxyribonuclease VII small subunit